MIGALRLVAILLILILDASPVSANERDAAAAEVLFQQGRDAMAAKNYDRACIAFEESLRHDQAVGAVMNLASCEEQRRHFASAWERWEQALRMLEPDDTRRVFAQHRSEELDQLVPRLTIVLGSSAPKDTRVVRDGLVLGDASLGVALPVDPGVHWVVVSSSRYEPQSYKVKLDVGQVQQVVVYPGSLKVEPKRLMTQKVLGISFTATGALGVFGGIVSGVMVERKNDIVSHHCDENLVCDERGLKAANQGQGLLVANAVSWGVGAAGLATGTILLITLPKKNATVAARLDLSSARVGMKISGTF